TEATRNEIKAKKTARIKDRHRGMSRKLSSIERLQPRIYCKESTPPFFSPPLLATLYPSKV
ncbi:MAG: hypothetical protein AAB767_00190, partial [Patescibacteria group bacterium]